jgi:hypothetical protein
VNHPGDLLSAWLDGEVDEASAAGVAAHVAACEACAAELDALRSARAALRSLPVVDPPLGFFERLPGRGPTRWAASMAAASAAAAFLVVGVGGTAVERVAPALGDRAAAHADQAESLPAAGTVSVGRGPGGGPAVAGFDVAAPFAAPDAMSGGYRRVAAGWEGDALHVVYDDGGSHLSLFEEVGRVDWDAMPPGQPVRVGGGVGRLYGVPEGQVLVWEAGDLVYTAVGDSPQALLAMAAGVGPPRELTLAQKLRRACRAAVDVAG